MSAWLKSQVWGIAAVALGIGAVALALVPLVGIAWAVQELLRHGPTMAPVLVFILAALATREDSAREDSAR